MSEAPETRNPLLSVRGAHVHLKVRDKIVRAVDGVDLDVFPGECVGIVGESGSGKSTLARAITRLMPPVEIARMSGEIVFDGEDVARIAEGELRALRRERGFAMVFQDPLSYLNPTRRVESQIAEALRHIRDKNLSRGRAKNLLTQVGLAEPDRILRCYPHELSGGMRQRVLIAMALASEPRLLVADEPTTALDATVQIQVIKLLQRLNREKQLALLVVTHDLALIAELCDRVYVMYAGRLVETADVFSLFDSPKHDYTASLIEAACRLHQIGRDGEVANSGVATSELELRP